MSDDTHRDYCIRSMASHFQQFLSCLIISICMMIGKFLSVNTVGQSILLRPLLGSMWLGSMGRGTAVISVTLDLIPQASVFIIDTLVSETCNNIPLCPCIVSLFLDLFAAVCCFGVALRQLIFLFHAYFKLDLWLFGKFLF